ncbi:hypothetical protein ABT324_00390 [Saccharopolyspora sp. NPDC000359]|uniref:hypothetical protein n=1 Tax=Saccharopolyspora sp. NPDC000359 TaxID=3154251 RepID=UPI00331C3377
MIAAAIAAGLLVLGGLALGAMFYFAPARHAGGGEGALTVAYLAARVEAESRSGGRHRLREPVVLRGDLAEALAVEETRLLPLASTGLPTGDEGAFARHPGVLRRVLVGLQNL